MNRHHPYGGYDTHPRRGHGGPGNERPSRGHRGRGGGRGRGSAPPQYPDGNQFQQNGYFSNDYSNESSYSAPVSDPYDAHEQSYGTYEGMSIISVRIMRGEYLARHQIFNKIQLRENSWNLIKIAKAFLPESEISSLSMILS